MKFHEWTDAITEAAKPVGTLWNLGPVVFEWTGEGTELKAQFTLWGQVLAYWYSEDEFSYEKLEDLVTLVRRMKQHDYYYSYAESNAEYLNGQQDYREIRELLSAWPPFIQTYLRQWLWGRHEYIDQLAKCQEAGLRHKDGVNIHMDSSQSAANM